MVDGKPPALLTQQSGSEHHMRRIHGHSVSPFPPTIIVKSTDPVKLNYSNPEPPIA